MPNVTFANIAAAATADSFSGVWKLTRAMKKSGWRYLASSDGSAMDTTANPVNDKWGGGTTTGNTGSAASLTTRSGYDTTVTGLTGMTSGSVGRYLTITGAASAANNGTWQIVTFVSSSSVTIRIVGGVASDANNGAISWTEKDAATDTYSSGTQANGSWWCAQGPSILKVPFTTAPSGTFIRGENVSQGTTGATAELVGVTFDQTGTGYLVLAPRLSGSGAGVQGWDGTHVITGAGGATVTPSATPIEYVQEIVFWKSSLLVGTVYYQCLDSVSEATSRFSYLAANAAGVTATIAPGGGGTGNAFPSLGSFVAIGTGGSQAGGNWTMSPTTTGFSKHQIMCANAIESANVSGDGSFTWTLGIPTGVGTTRASVGFSLQRLDDCEDGDVNPYTVMSLSTAAIGSRSRTVNTASYGSELMWNSSSMFSNGHFCIIRRRGLSGESFIGAMGGLLVYQAGLLLGSASTTDQDKVACAQGSVVIREPVWVISSSLGAKVRKGNCRWIYAVNGMTAYDTMDGKLWFTPDTTQAAAASLLLGPYDGSSTPAQ